jgi:hypothetical protein
MPVGYGKVVAAAFALPIVKQKIQQKIYILPNFFPTMLKQLAHNVQAVTLAASAAYSYSLVKRWFFALFFFFYC